MTLKRKTGRPAAWPTHRNFKPQNDGEWAAALWNGGSKTATWTDVADALGFGVKEARAMAHQSGIALRPVGAAPKRDRRRAGRVSHLT
jgi:hypothetical protein